MDYDIGLRAADNDFESRATTGAGKTRRRACHGTPPNTCCPVSTVIVYSCLDKRILTGNMTTKEQKVAFWNDIETLGKTARVLPYVLIFIGFIVAASGQFFKSIIDTRIGKLEAAAQSTYKNTRPLIKPFLGHSATSGKKLLVMDTENAIPFRANWLIVTEKNQLVSPFMTSQKEIFPTEDNKRFSAEITINSEKVLNRYIELRFRYESIYSGELNDPPHLRVEIRKKYRFVNGQILPWIDTTSTNGKD